MEDDNKFFKQWKKTSRKQYKKIDNLNETYVS